jgi:hypothetical protein
LIQGHADTVRDMARARRQSASKPAPSTKAAETHAPPEAGAAPPEPGGPPPAGEDPGPSQAQSVKELFYGEES